MRGLKMTSATLTQTKVQLTGEQVKTIQAALKHIQKNKNNYYILHLEHGKFNISNNQLYFTTLDENNKVTIRLQDSLITGDNNTNWLFPLSALRELKGVKKTDTFILTLDYSQATLSHNGITQTIQTKQDKFPHVKPVESDKQFTVNSDYVKSLHDAVTFVSNNEARPVLQHILHKDGSHIATDSHRLYKRDNVYDNVYDNDTLANDILVHPTTAKLVYNLMKSEDKINVTEDGRHISYNTDDITVQGTLCDFNYPDVSRILPQNFNYEFEFNKKAMLNILKQTKKNQLLQLELLKDRNNNELSLTVMDYDHNEILNATLKVNKQSMRDDMKVVCNVTFFTEALKQMDDEQIKMNVTGSMTPFTLEGEKDYHLILPVRITK
jgi:DNA polymerase III sliding clamp (beta) subunit (PCNA family)